MKTATALRLHRLRPHPAELARALRQIGDTDPADTALASLASGQEPALRKAANTVFLARHIESFVALALSAARKSRHRWRLDDLLQTTALAMCVGLRGFKPSLGPDVAASVRSFVWETVVYAARVDGRLEALGDALWRESLVGAGEHVAHLLRGAPVPRRAAGPRSPALEAA